MGGQEDAMRVLTCLAPLHSRASVLARPCPVPAAPGVYAWFFRDVPLPVPVSGCVTRDGLVLLYVGISPRGLHSTQNLRKRITNHYRGNAEGSTLRLSLGVILECVTGFPLRRVGSGRRMTFTHPGEQSLDDWMLENAYVCWIEHPQPWTVEHELLRVLNLPLNLESNRRNGYWADLSQLRRQAKQSARDAPIALQINQHRKRP